MSEKFLPRQDTSRDPDLMELGQEILSQANSPRELIVAMRNWVLMREDLRSGKYIEVAAKRGGTSENPNPYEALKLRDEIRDKTGIKNLGLGLEVVLYGAEEIQRQSDTALTNLIDLAWQKFSTSNPSPEEITLFKEQVPQLADRADSLKVDD